MKSCTSVTTIGMTVQGFDTQVTSADHSDLHDLRLDLTEAGLQAALSGAFRDQDAGRAQERVDDVAHPQANCSTCPLTPARITVLLDLASAWASAASALAFSAGRRAESFASAPSLAAVPPRSRLCGPRRRPEASRYRGAPQCPRCAVAAPPWSPVHQRPAEGALGLLDLAFRRHDVRARDHHGRINLGDLATGGLNGCFLLRAVQSEDRSAFATRSFIPI